MKLYVSPEHPYAKKKQISLYRLDKYPFVNFTTNKSNYESFYSDILERYGVKIAASISTNNSNIINDCMRNDCGYYVATDYTHIIGSHAEDRLKFISIPITPKIYILYLALFSKDDNESITYFKQLFLQMYPKARLQ